MMSRYHHRLRQLRSLLLRSGLLLGVLLASGQAQVATAIRPDGTLGTAVTQSGTVHTITESFDCFSVGTNETVGFSGPPGIVNILSRVTGGQQSTIPGAKRTLDEGEMCS